MVIYALVLLLWAEILGLQLIVNLCLKSDLLTFKCAVLKMSEKNDKF
jgi:hypothetical protein